MSLIRYNKLYQTINFSINYRYGEGNAVKQSEDPDETSHYLYSLRNIAIDCNG